MFRRLIQWLRRWWRLLQPKQGKLRSDYVKPYLVRPLLIGGKRHGTYGPEAPEGIPYVHLIPPLEGVSPMPSDLGAQAAEVTLNYETYTRRAFANPGRDFAPFLVYALESLSDEEALSLYLGGR